MRLLAPLPSGLELPIVEAPVKWLGTRLAIYALVVGAVTALAFCVLAIFGPAIYLGDMSPELPDHEKRPIFWRDIDLRNDAPTVPVDDAMLVAGGIDLGKFIALPVTGTSVVDGSGKRVGVLREVIIGQDDNVVGIVVRKSSGWLAGSRDIIVPSSLYRFRNDKQLGAGGQGKPARDVATIDLSSAQIDALPSVQSLGK